MWLSSYFGIALSLIGECGSPYFDVIALCTACECRSPHVVDIALYASGESGSPHAVGIDLCTSCECSSLHFVNIAL